MVALSELVDIKGGGTPSKKHPEYWNGNIPWASVKDFRSLRLTTTEDYITKLGVENSATNIIPAETIIIPTRMALGKVAITTVDLAINQDLKALMIKNQGVINRQYLFRFLESKARFIEKQGKGATVKGITLDVLRQLEVPLPPLPEQKRIAAILDKADAIRRKRQQAIDLADEFLRSVFLDMFGDPVTNPKGWEISKLGEISTIYSGATPSKSNEPFWEGDYPWVSPKDMKSLIINDSEDHISEIVFEETSQKKIPKNSLLLVVRGMILAHTVPIVITARDVSINQDVKAFVPNPNVSPIYMLYCLKCLHTYLLSKVSTAAHGTKRIDMDLLTNLDIISPSEEMQKKFEGIVKKYRDYSFKIDNHKTGSNEEFNALSQQAFSGKL